MVISIFANYKRIFKRAVVTFSKEKSLLHKYNMNIVNSINIFSEIVYAISLEGYVDFRCLVGH